MTDSLKDAASKVFNNFELSESKLKQLNRLANTNSQPSFDSWFKISKVASLFILIGFLSFMGLSSYKEYRADSLVDRIVAEVVKNHSQLKPLEVSSSNLVNVSAYFDRLSFSPFHSLQSDVVKKIELLLVGGRYCSIQGNTAAQLRMKNASGSYSTLFQTQDLEYYNSIPSLAAGQKVLQYFSHGYEVKMWREKGLLMVLVEPAKSQ